MTDKQEIKINLKADITDVQLFVTTLEQFCQGKASERDLLRTINFTDRETAGDPIVEANRLELRRRSEVGIEKYGTKLDRTDFNQKQWLQHLLEELLDAANYTQALLQRRRADTSIDIPWFRNLWEQYNANMNELRKVEVVLSVPPDQIGMTPNELAKMQERHTVLKGAILTQHQAITQMLQADE